MKTDWEVIDDGSFNGLKKSIRGTEEDHGSVEVKYEDVSRGALVEQNKRADTHKVDKEMWHVGHIPASVGLKWLIEEQIDIWDPNEEMQKRVTRKLMDSDYRHLVPGMSKIWI